MNSPFKFPRRVRIHGGECGAVARALHHEAQKVALTQNEQTLISDECVLLRQAVFKKSLKTTFIERKQMSTKTLRKRIALVAVSALGFGLVSAAPSSAAGTTTIASLTVASSGVAYTTTGTAATAGISLSTGGTFDAADTIALSVDITSKPVGSVVAVENAHATNAVASNKVKLTGVEATANSNSSPAASGETIVVTLTAAQTTAASAATININPDLPGKYVLTVTGDAVTGTDLTATFTVYASSAASAPTATSATALTTSTDKTVYRADLDSVTLNVTRPVGGVASDGDVNYVVVTSPDAGMTPGTIVTADTSSRATAGGFEYTTGASSSSLEISNNFVNTQGAYSVRAYVDTNGDDVYQSTETSALFSWIMAAAPDALSVSFDKSSAVTTTSLQLFGVVTVKDDEGYASYLDGSETITTTFSEDKGVTYTSTKLTVGTALSTSTRISGTNTYRTVINAYNGGTALVASVDAYRIKIAITGATTAATASFTSVDADASRLTSLSMTSVDGLITGSGATLTKTIPANVPASTLAATAVRSDLPVKTHTFTLVGTPLKTYAVTFSVGSLTNIANFTYPTSVRTLTDGAVVFTVTNSAPTEDDSYAISVVDTTSTVLYAGYSVTWDDLVASWSMSPTASSNPKVLKGTTNKVTATLTDNFGRVLANAPYSVSVSGRNVTAASGTTDATGTATYTVTDTATSSYTTYPSDTVTFSSVATTDIAAGTGSVTFSYVETLAAVATVTVSNPTDLTMDIDQREATAGAASDRKTWTATVRLASGAVAGSGVLVTFSADADTIFYLGVNTGVTDASGQATVTAFKRKAGNILMTATANGVSGSALVPVVAANADGNGTSSASVRSIAVTSAQTIVGGSVATVVATVTDRWGNPVNNIGVTFVLSGVGRLNTGSSLTAATNAAGVAQVQVTSAPAEVGTMNIVAAISTANGQVSDLAGRVAGLLAGDATTAPAGNYTAATSVSFTKDTSVSTADALLELAKAIGTGKEVEAAADAAAEAIDAANAATDAANLAAEAADAATVAAEEARDAADAATAAVEELSTQVATLMAALKAQLTTLANTVAKIAKKVKA